MATAQDTTKDPAAKRAALALLAQGLITKAEAARLAGVSRQLVGHWAGDMPIERNREQYLSKIWRKALARKR
jgi:hypothetical protein